VPNALVRKSLIYLSLDKPTMLQYFHPSPKHLFTGA